MRKIRTYNSISTHGLDRFPRDSYEISSEISEPDAIMLRSQNLHDTSFPDQVKAIARCGAGVNNIPVSDCTHQGIVVFNTPGANANAVKELVLTGMLISSRNVIGGLDFARNLMSERDNPEFSKLVEKGKKDFVGSELAGKTLGVIGLGAIGASVAHAALSLGMKVIGYDPALSVDAAWQLSSQIKRAENMQWLLARCDFVSLHVPANEKTKDLLNADTLSHIKEGAVLLNFARGSIVNQQALLSSLEQECIGQYVCDFPSPELLDHPKVISLPHLGASTLEAEQNCASMAADQLMDFLENGNIRNSVNFPSITLDRTQGYRIAFANDNVPKVLSHVLSVLSDMEINVIDMLNRSRDDIAYTIVDIASEPTDELLAQISSVEHVFNVRTF
ncbi:phosphoglycerate dehydrogenase [Vibrio sp. JC009]|uniref:phosphoglycerate dehydrogenase n=1 Tax=Vibrio sp. JC009 TaxID=2912314 RepID=UPI0023AFCD8E|nr:phosphoglycerate dehydrogenase [Vibrio sp. JC009]WED23866.1 phosphoglycerate dehydrogenase [Vibrio sp. JC009]